MNTNLLRRVRKMFACEYAPRSVQRHNMRAWARSVRLLGDKWLIANPARRAA